MSVILHMLDFVFKHYTLWLDWEASLKGYSVASSKSAKIYDEFNSLKPCAFFACTFTV